jgi:hypothetical protein
MSLTKITMAEFEQILTTHEQPIEVKVTTRTNPKMLVKHREDKTPNPWPNGLRRLTEQTVVLGASYAKSVNAQRASEGLEEDFVAKGLWVSKQYPEGAGERDTPFTVRHKGTGKRYFSVQLKDGTTSSTWVTPSGEPVDYELVKPYMSESKPSPGRQGTETQVVWRTIDLDSIVHVEIKDDLYDIEASETDESGASE